MASGIPVCSVQLGLLHGSLAVANFPARQCPTAAAKPDDAYCCDLQQRPEPATSSGQERCSHSTYSGRRITAARPHELARQAGEVRPATASVVPLHHAWPVQAAWGLCNQADFVTGTRASCSRRGCDLAAIFASISAGLPLKLATRAVSSVDSLALAERSFGTITTSGSDARRI